MRRLAAPMLLIAARARRRPGRWILTVLGVSLAVAFAGAVAAEGTIAGDQAAHSVLQGLTRLDRVVRVTWQGVVTASVDRKARSLLDGLGLRRQTEVVLLTGVRLGGAVVQPAAIDPLNIWLARGADGRVRRCRPRSCPVLLAGPVPLHRRLLSAPGIRLVVAGAATLLSSAPLGFTPSRSSDATPLLLSGDVRGLDALAGVE